jgi:hypothetical protein
MTPTALYFLVAYFTTGGLLLFIANRLGGRRE